MYLEKNWVMSKEKKNQTKPTAHYYKLQHTCGCGSGVYKRHRSAQRLFFCGQRKIFYCFFPTCCLTHFTASAVRCLYIWSDNWGHFVRTVPGWASFIARRWPGQGCDATCPSSPPIYFSGRCPRSRRKTVVGGRGMADASRKNKELNLKWSRGGSESEEKSWEKAGGDWEEGGERCAALLPGGRLSSLCLPWDSSAALNMPVIFNPPT